MNSYYKLESIVDEIDVLIEKSVDSNSPDFVAWKTKAERFIIKEFGQESYEFQQFNKFHFTLTIYAGGTPQSEFAKACKRDLLKAKAFFNSLLEDYQEKSIPDNEKNIISKHKEKKYQVFVSSTYEDLKEERALVTQCLLDIGCIPVGMEQFPASGMSQMDYIKKMLADCDYYILILAGRYGSCDSNGISFTEKEYDYAASIGMPIMSFVIKDVEQLQQSKCEKTDAGRTRLKAFREKVCKDKMVKMYSSPAELQAFVAVSMQKCVKDFPAVGWIRADRVVELQISDEMIGQKIEKYLQDNIRSAAGMKF